MMRFLVMWLSQLPFGSYLLWLSLANGTYDTLIFRMLFFMVFLMRRYHDETLASINIISRAWRDAKTSYYSLSTLTLSPALSYIDNIYTLHGLPTVLISDDRMFSSSLVAYGRNNFTNFISTWSLSNKKEVNVE
jgi:hypothetical protein